MLSYCGRLIEHWAVNRSVTVIKLEKNWIINKCREKVCLAYESKINSRQRIFYTIIRHISSLSYWWRIKNLFSQETYLRKSQLNKLLWKWYQWQYNFFISITSKMRRVANIWGIVYRRRRNLIL